MHQTPNGLYYDLWALPRPMTRTWGSGSLFKRLCENFGDVDMAFGKTDGIPEGVQYADLENGIDWKDLPYQSNSFNFGYWDPPYDKMYKPEGVEIWRTCRQLAILHPKIYPTSWFADAKRIAMIAITMGPLKDIRCLQIFRKVETLPFQAKEAKP